MLLCVWVCGEHEVHNVNDGKVRNCNHFFFNYYQPNHRSFLFARVAHGYVDGLFQIGMEI